MWPWHPNECPKPERISNVEILERPGRTVELLEDGYSAFLLLYPYHMLHLKNGVSKGMDG